MTLWDLLQQPFMQRALYGGLIVALLTASIGVFVTLKKQSFLADGVAHASLAGVAIAFALAISPTPIALLTGVFMAIAITYIQKNSNLASDAVIGIVYSFLFAVGIIVLNLSPSYRPELSTYLFGSILSISWGDIGYAFVTLLVTLLFFTSFYRQLIYVTFDTEAAQIRGIKTQRFEYLQNILTSIVIIVSIKIVGIVLVTALLIMPATAAKLIARNFKQMMPLALIISVISFFSGMIMSYLWNSPTGATIVVSSALLFFLIFVFQNIFRRE
jgi:zinc transport system permease protein